ncbi:peptidoglycan-binding protein [Paractinoplanes globisporus]|uniref:Peptidoglycan-binding protein n=1 Tax=Paractinoplanes globisporus TaxID=113565 RepID=A0ABW6WDU3_9ACTN|nr:peptidoglycan-binding protein [Actinoplanes globisporus]
MRRRRARAVTVCGAVVLAAGAAAAAAAGFGGEGPDEPVPSGLPPATAQVTRQTMHDTAEASGDLGWTGRTALAGRIPGVVTWVPQPGDRIGRGGTVYRVDDRPVVLIYGPVPAYRSLGPGAVGADVRELEENLHALGYGGFTVDTRYTASTAAAVRRWQRATGLPRTGTVDLGRVVVAPGPIRVDTVTAGISQSTGGGEVLAYTGTTRIVTVDLDVSQQRLARRGVAVQVTMPDGGHLAGRVERVHTVVEQPTGDNTQPTTRIEATVSLPGRGVAADLDAAVVTVAFTAAERANVLTVPVAALVALAEGGYGVEVVDGRTTRYLRVTTGLFANGLVEVAGDGLRAGLTVGMPR